MLVEIKYPAFSSLQIPMFGTILLLHAVKWSMGALVDVVRDGIDVKEEDLTV